MSFDLHLVLFLETVLGLRTLDHCGLPQHQINI